MAVKCSTMLSPAIFRLGGGRAKSQPLNVGLRPGAGWDPSLKISIFELGGTGRRGAKQAGVLWVATTPPLETGGTHLRVTAPGISQGHPHRWIWGVADRYAKQGQQEGQRHKRAARRALSLVVLEQLNKNQKWWCTV